LEFSESDWNLHATLLFNVLTTVTLTHVQTEVSYVTTERLAYWGGCTSNRCLLFYTNAPPYARTLHFRVSLTYLGPNLFFYQVTSPTAGVIWEKATTASTVEDTVPVPGGRVYFYVQVPDISGLLLASIETRFGTSSTHTMLGTTVLLGYRTFTRHITFTSSSTSATSPSQFSTPTQPLSMKPGVEFLSLVAGLGIGVVGVLVAAFLIGRRQRGKSRRRKRSKH